MTDAEILARFAAVDGGKLSEQMVVALRDADDATRARLLDTWQTAGITSSDTIAELKHVAVDVAAVAGFASSVAGIGGLIQFLVGLK
jgi:hypothetical protein